MDLKWTAEDGRCSLPDIELALNLVGRMVAVAFGVARSVATGKNCVLVKNLARRTGWQELKDWGRNAGQVEYTDVWEEHGKKVGVIKYESYKDMLYAVEKLDDTKLDGAYVRVQEDKADGRTGSASPSRSRSRSGSRGKKITTKSLSKSRSPRPSKLDVGGKNVQEDDRDRIHEGAGRGNNNSSYTSGRRKRSPSHEHLDATMGKPVEDRMKSHSPIAEPYSHGPKSLSRSRSR